MRQYEFLVQVAKFVKALLIFVLYADFIDNVEDFGTSCTFGDAVEEITHDILIEVDEKIGVHMTKIANILFPHGKRIHKQENIGGLPPSADPPTNFHQLLQHSMLLLHIVFPHDEAAAVLLDH